MTLLEAKTILATIKLNISLDSIASNSLFSDSDLTTAIDLGNKRAWDYRRWPFALETLKLTYDPPTAGEYYLDYPNTFVDETIGKIRVNGLEWSKRNFDDYQKWRGENPTATNKYWATYKRQWFANANALTTGDEIALEGKLRAPTLSVSTDLLAFSPDMDNNEDSGNEAIVKFAFATLLGSEKMKQYDQALREQKEAMGMLDILWAPMRERESREQSINRPFFEVGDFFSGRAGGNTNIGNLN